MSAENPLTARVIANRFWEQIFGIGLVRTSEEFGTQGELPSHPELLDWLAIELADSNWDVKAFLKLLVTSAAYRQSAKVTPELFERDPDNRLLARGPRVRLSAEMVRDQALSAAGLLSPKMLGPVGAAAAAEPRPERRVRRLDRLADERRRGQYRRGLYTQWRRSNPYPSMSTFDAPNRDICIVRRTRTNTPLQALVTLNDPVYVEAAQALARRTIEKGGDDHGRESRVRVPRVPGPPADATRKLTRLVKLYEDAKAKFAKDAAKATQLATNPLGPLPKGMDVADAAAWTVVAQRAAEPRRNVDEAVTLAARTARRPS